MPKGASSIEMGYFTDSLEKEEEKKNNPESDMNFTGQRLLIFGRYAGCAATN